MNEQLQSDGHKTLLHKQRHTLRYYILWICKKVQITRNLWSSVFVMLNPHKWMVFFKEVWGLSPEAKLKQPVLDGFTVCYIWNIDMFTLNKMSTSVIYKNRRVRKCCRHFKSIVTHSLTLLLHHSATLKTASFLRESGYMLQAQCSQAVQHTLAGKLETHSQPLHVIHW